MLLDFATQGIEAAHRSIGSILSSFNPENIDLFIKYDGIPTLLECLKYQKTAKTQKMILWALSNLTAGTDKQIRAFLAVDEGIQVMDIMT